MTCRFLFGVASCWVGWALSGLLVGVGSSWLVGWLVGPLSLSSGSVGWPCGCCWSRCPVGPVSHCPSRFGPVVPARSRCVPTVVDACCACGRALAYARREPTARWVSLSQWACPLCQGCTPLCRPTTTGSSSSGKHYRRLCFASARQVGTLLALLFGAS